MWRREIYSFYLIMRTYIKEENARFRGTNIPIDKSSTTYI